MAICSVKVEAKSASARTTVEWESRTAYIAEEVNLFSVEEQRCGDGVHGCWVARGDQRPTLLSWFE